MAEVTIGIPFRNPGRDFESALKSVFAQTFGDWELLLVDDGSSDGSIDFARRIADPRVRVISDGRCRRLPARLNQIAREASAPYLFRMDADDMMHPERVEKQLALLREAGYGAVVGSAAYSIGPDGALLGIKPPRAKGGGFASRHAFIHPTVAAATEWFRKNPYNEDYPYTRAEDAELWCRTKPTSRFIYISDPLLFYREAQGMAFSNYVASTFALTNIIRRYFAFPLGRYFFLMSRELTKLLAFAMLERYGKLHWLLRQRYAVIPSSERERATQIYFSILYRALPLSEPLP